MQFQVMLSIGPYVANTPGYIVMMWRPVHQGTEQRKNTCMYDSIM